MTLNLPSTGVCPTPVASPLFLTHHPKLYFQDSLTTFLAGALVPLYVLVARFVSPSVKGQLFRVHRRESQWLRYLSTYGSCLNAHCSWFLFELEADFLNALFSLNSPLTQSGSRMVKGAGDDNPIPLPVHIP